MKCLGVHWCALVYPAITLSCPEPLPLAPRRPAFKGGHLKDQAQCRIFKSPKAKKARCVPNMPRKRAAKKVSTLIPHRSPQLTELLEAAKTCSHKTVRQFLAVGGLPDTLVEVQYNGGSSVFAPLIFKAIAVHQDAEDPALHHASLELLLQAGANANAIGTNPDGLELTILMAACRVTCCTASVRLLLAHGSNPALQTPAGEAALHVAASKGRADVCNMLLEADGSAPDVRDGDGLTSLARAVQLGHLGVVELLHKQWGADLSNAVSDGGTVTLLHIAAASGQRGVVEYLVQAGLNVNAARHDGLTPVQVALEGGNKAVQTLLEHGASTAAVDNGGHNLLAVVVGAGHADLVELLLCSASANNQLAVDVNAADADGDTALHLAAHRDRTAAAAVLLHHGAAVNALNGIGAAPLVLAAAYASAELVQLLLDAGADFPVNSAALHAAVFNDKRPEVLQLLLEQSSASDMLDSLAFICNCCDLRTPIMRCAQPAHLKLLLAAGADVHVTTDTGSTALQVAAVHKFAAPVLCLLIKAGVDLHAENSDGKTAAQVAADTGNTLAAALLTRAARDA
jgi:ankyrin repeat protein